LKVFKYLVQYLVFKYYLNTPKCEVFHKVFKYSGQSICYNTDFTKPRNHIFRKNSKKRIVIRQGAAPGASHRGW